MGTETLTDEDRRLLERLRSGALDFSSRTAETADEASESDATEQLERMADNGLVARDDEGCWRLTGSGRRAIAAPGDGSSDERIDTPSAVEERLAESERRPDREDAVRAAFSFLQHWGVATGAEIRDAVYDAWPAGYATATEWWTDCVRYGLSDLPGVDAPAHPDGEWRYANDDVEDDASVKRRPANGRLAVIEGEDTEFASAKHAIEHVADGEGEREALSAAFAVLESDGRTTRERLVGAVFDDHQAHFDTLDAWYAWIANAFETIPGVEPTGEDEWRYVARD